MQANYRSLHLSGDICKIRCAHFTCIYPLSYPQVIQELLSYLQDSQYSATPWLITLAAIQLSGCVTCIAGSPTEIISTPSACTASDVTASSANRTFGVGHIVMIKREEVDLARYPKFEAFVGVQRSGTLLMRSCPGVKLKDSLKIFNRGVLATMFVYPSVRPPRLLSI